MKGPLKASPDLMWLGLVVFPKDHPEFITITCLDWKYLLVYESCKQIIVNSLSFLVADNRAIIYAFVIMSNHMHLIWQYTGRHDGHAVRRDFLKYTSQQILRLLDVKNSGLLESLRVNKHDRKFQVWQRDALCVPLWSDRVFDQKLDYIHWNPVKAGICKHPEDYKYSSASFYVLNKSEWKFLTHADG